jgi:hypothetical protein
MLAAALCVLLHVKKSQHAELSRIVDCVASLVWTDCIVVQYIGWEAKSLLEIRQVRIT